MTKISGNEISCQSLVLITAYQHNAVQPHHSLLIDSFPELNLLGLLIGDNGNSKACQDMLHLQANHHTIESVQAGCLVNSLLV